MHELDPTIQGNRSDGGSMDPRVKPEGDDWKERTALATTTDVMLGLDPSIQDNCSDD